MTPKPLSANATLEFNKRLCVEAARSYLKRPPYEIAAGDKCKRLEDRFTAPGAAFQSLRARILAANRSPQVAARAAHHWHVSKAIQAGETRTLLKKLDASSRQEEIARMLSGATVTQEARNAAKSLLESAFSATAPAAVVKRGRR